jgi:A/G-specific adenine glycosylase
LNESAASSLAGALLSWHERHGRAQLPWRTERTPYRTVVSEFMLQQTQVERVVPIFERFVAAFDSFAALAAAPRAEAVRLWRGLGYNSRAVRLHRLAIVVCDRFAGSLPRDEATLLTLPGVGPYTARAILAFAFDADVVALDTNIRRVVHRACFGLEYPPLARDDELDARATRLLPPGRGFAYNSALMDLGATVCTSRTPRCLVCPLLHGCAAAPVDGAQLADLAARHARPRSPQQRIPFERSTRFVRGRIIDRLRLLGPHERVSLLELGRDLEATVENLESGVLLNILHKLASDGVVEQDGAGVRLA